MGRVQAPACLWKAALPVLASPCLGLFLQPPCLLERLALPQQLDAVRLPRGCHRGGSTGRRRCHRGCCLSGCPGPSPAASRYLWPLLHLWEGKKGGGTREGGRQGFSKFVQVSKELVGWEDPSAAGRTRTLGAPDVADAWAEESMRWRLASRAPPLSVSTSAFAGPVATPTGPGGGAPAALAPSGRFQENLLEAPALASPGTGAAGAPAGPGIPPAAAKRGEKGLKSPGAPPLPLPRPGPPRPLMQNLKLAVSRARRSAGPGRKRNAPETGRRCRARSVNDVGTSFTVVIWDI